MDKIIEKKIHQLVLEKIDLNKFGGSSYWDWYRWIKSLNLGHRPTKVEINEVLFFGLSVMQNPDDWRNGAKQLAEKALPLLKGDVKTVVQDNTHHL